MSTDLQQKSVSVPELSVITPAISASYSNFVKETTHNFVQLSKLQQKNFT